MLHILFLFPIVKFLLQNYSSTWFESWNALWFPQALQYEIGDVLEILPGQDSAAVDAFIQRCNLDPDSFITVSNSVLVNINVVLRSSSVSIDFTLSCIVSRHKCNIRTMFDTFNQLNDILWTSYTNKRSKSCGCFCHYFMFSGSLKPCFRWKFFYLGIV